MQGTSKTFKLLIVGDEGCGKTCLLKVFTGDRFLDTYELPTFDSYEADIEVDGNRVRLHCVLSVKQFQQTKPTMNHGIRK